MNNESFTFPSKANASCREGVRYPRFCGITWWEPPPPQLLASGPFHPSSLSREVTVALGTGHQHPLLLNAGWGGI